MDQNNYIKEKGIKNTPDSIPINILKTVIEQTEKSICRIICKDEGNGTGFFGSIPFPDKYNLLPVLITNNHVVDKDDLIEGNTINLTLNNDKIPFKIKIDNSRKVYTNEKYDITFIEIKNTDGFDLNTFLDLDDRVLKVKSNEELNKLSAYLIFYPSGKEVEYSTGIIKSISEDNNIEHTCSSKPGSSGSPILNLNNNKVIGVHKGASDSKNWSLGTFIKGPINKFYQEEMNNNKTNLLEDKKEIIKNYDNENTGINKNPQKYKNITYKILTEDYPNCDLRFKLIIIGDYSKKIIFIIIS